MIDEQKTFFLLSTHEYFGFFDFFQERGPKPSGLRVVAAFLIFFF